MEINRETINQQYVDILENGSPDIDQQIKILRALTDLNGLALPKASSIESLKSMSRQQLQDFINEHQAKMIDVTPATSPTPRGGVGEKDAKYLKAPQKNFKKVES